MSIRVISQIASLILIRVLAPADFGLVAIASLVIGSLQLIKELGFGQALLRRPDRGRRSSRHDVLCHRRQQPVVVHGGVFRRTLGGQLLP